MPDTIAEAEASQSGFASDASELDAADFECYAGDLGRGTEEEAEPAGGGDFLVLDATALEAARTEDGLLLSALLGCTVEHSREILVRHRFKARGGVAFPGGRTFPSASHSPPGAGSQSCELCGCGADALRVCTGRPGTESDRAPCGRRAALLRRGLLSSLPLPAC